MPKPSDGAKKLIGDFSPKLVELTDRVLAAQERRDKMIPDSAQFDDSKRHSSRAL
jgi:hypothetical protein